MMALYFFIEFLEFIFFELIDGLCQYFLIGLKTNFVDKTTLLASKQISGPPDFKVFHCNIKTTAQFGELFKCLNTLAGIGGHNIVGWGYKIAKGLFVASSHATSHLMQIAQAKIIG